MKTKTAKTPKEIIADHYRKIGRVGGLASTKAKAKTARENGKLGGRPRKKL